MQTQDDVWIVLKLHMADSRSRAVETSEASCFDEESATRGNVMGSTDNGVFLQRKIEHPAQRWYVRARWLGQQHDARRGRPCCVGWHDIDAAPVVVHDGVVRGESGAAVMGIEKQAGEAPERRAIAFIPAGREFSIQELPDGVGNFSLTTAQGGWFHPFLCGTRKPDAVQQRKQRIGTTETLLEEAFLCLALVMSWSIGSVANGPPVLVQGRGGLFSLSHVQTSLFHARNAVVFVSSRYLAFLRVPRGTRELSVVPSHHSS